MRWGFVALLSCLIACAQAQFAINTLPYDGGILGSFSPMRDPGMTRDFGQTFVAPYNARSLNRITFVFQLDSFATGSFPVQLFIMKWAGARPTGGILYQSAAVNMPADYQAHPISFSMNVPMVPGQSYVAFVSTRALPFNEDYSLEGWLGMTDVDRYPAGQPVTYWGIGGPELWTTEDWDVAIPSADLMFKAEFKLKPISVKPG